MGDRRIALYFQKATFSIDGLGRRFSSLALLDNKQAVEETSHPCSPRGVGNILEASTDGASWQDPAEMPCDGWCDDSETCDTASREHTA